MQHCHCYLNRKCCSFNISFDFVDMHSETSSNVFFIFPLGIFIEYMQTSSLCSCHIIFKFKCSWTNKAFGNGSFIQSKCMEMALNVITICAICLFILLLKFDHMLMLITLILIVLSMSLGLQGFCFSCTFLLTTRFLALSH